MRLNVYSFVKTLLILVASCSSLSVFGQQGGSDNSVVSITRNSADNTPKSISFSSTANWQQSQAQELFRRYLGITAGGDLAMVLKNTLTTKNNTTTTRFDQYYKGIKVAFGGYTLSGKDGKVNFMTGNFYAPSDNPSSTPALTSAAAFSKALQFVGADKYKWQNPIEEAHIKSETGKSDTSYLPKGKLVWVEDLRSGQKGHKLHLAWSFDIYAEEPLSRQEVFVDAGTGRVLFANQMLKHTAASGGSKYSGIVPFQSSFVAGTYRLYDSTRGNGVHTRNMNNGTSYGAATNFTSATNTWPNAPANDIALDAHWGGAMVYDYFLTEHGRLSWDGLNGIMLQYVHYGTNYNNAYWNGTAMTYGDGSGIAAGGFSPLTSLDVTAHEVGHGVCQATCDLIYESEPGALNEAFSDCWAATIEHWADPGETDAMPKAHWEIGEEIGTEPLRSMNTPILQGQPDTYGGTNWFNVVACTPTGGNDYCGVHRNSGLMNYWYYLLVNGGTGTNDNSDDYVVNPLGWAKAAIILYESEIVLSSVADYADMRIASINAANMLYGPCSPEAQCVTSAWYAVGVGADYMPCAPQIAFTVPSVRISEQVTAATCPATKTLNIGLRPNGPVIAGGSPVANIVVASSTAVLGVDYTLSATSVTFPAGDTSTKYITMTIFDNGAVNDNKQIDLAFTVAPMGSGAVIAPFNDTMTIFIDNNDSIPHSGGVLYPLLNAGIPVVSNFTSPFYGSQRRARSQFLLYANELTAAGVVPGVPISQIAFNVITKNSTGPFTGYTVSMRNTTVADLYTNFVTTGLIQVYTGNHTTNVGTDSIDFNTGTFTWDGVSNVVVQLCFGMTPAAFTANDMVAGVQQGAFTIGDYNTSNSGSGTGCSLGFSAGNRAVVRPVMRFKQIVPPTKIETTAASTRVWNVHAGQEVYFYNPADTQVIAGIKGMDNNLGCVTATVTQQGNGVVPAVFSAINRSRKEVSINPTINGSITTYDVTFYLTNTELAGITPSTLKLLKTTAPTDATVSNANSVLVTPTLVTAGNYVGFRGTFTGFSRYMLVDGPLCNTPDAYITAAGPTTFCLGGSVLLDAPTGAGLSYQWQKDGANIPGATTASYTAAIGGNYTITINQSVCDSVSLPLTVVVDSAYAAPITGAATACIGQATPLSSATPSGVWSSSNIAIATVSPSGVVTGVSLGTVVITYAVTNPCGTGVATYTMTVNSPSVVAPTTGTFTVCNGSSTTLSNATPSGVWSSGAAAIGTVDVTGMVTGVGAGTAPISYAYTNPFGCVSYATALVTVNTTPAATTTPAGAVVICTGTSVTLNAAPSAGHTYQWQSGGADIPGATSAAFTTAIAGNFRVRITNTLGCTGVSPDVNVSISTSAIVVPSVTVTASIGFNICVTTSPVLFTATPVNGGGSPAYQWSVNGTVVGGAGATYSYVPANGDVVACQLTSSLPCAIPATATATRVMTVNPFVSPMVSISASPNDTVCTGDVVTYSAVPTWGGSAPEYLWTENGINVATGPMYIIAPLNGDVIVCRMTSNYPCLLTPTATSAPFTMRVQVPVANTVSVSASAAVSATGVPVTFVAIAPNAGSAPSYQWYVNSVAVPGATSATFTSSTLVNGQIVSCMVTSSLLCATPRNNLSGGFTVKITAGIEETMPDGNKMILIPNPNRGSFVIMGDAATEEPIRISVVNVLGQEVYAKDVATVNGKLNTGVELLGSIAPGMYLVSVVSGSHRVVFHVAIEK